MHVSYAQRLPRSSRGKNCHRCASNADTIFVVKYTAVYRTHAIICWLYSASYEMLIWFASFWKGFFYKYDGSEYSLRWFLKAEKFFLFQYDQELVLPCDFFGNPTPEISWFKDNSSTPVKAKWSSIDNNGSLIIQGLCKYINESGVRLPNDRRLYTAVEFGPSPRKTNPTLFYETEGLGIYFLFLKATLALGSSIP